MRTHYLAGAGLFLTLLLAPAAEAQPALSEKIDDEFAMDDLWNDGKAEMATYDSTRVVYGKTREFTSRLITVKEDFTKEYYTKADWPYGQKPILPVLKQNYVATIQAENYPYHYMTSAFVQRDDFDRTIKLTVSSQEWCGITTKDFSLWQEPAREVYISYWEGEGTGERSLPIPADTFFEEELFIVLRALDFENSDTASLRIFPNQTSSKAPEPKSSPATLTVSEGEEAWEVNIAVADGRSMTYLFLKAYPHVLQRFEHSDGRTMTLESLEREAYWKR